MKRPKHRIEKSRRKKTKAWYRQSPRYWVAVGSLGALMAYTAGGGRTEAQDAAGSLLAQSSVPAKSLKVLKFEIAAGNLKEALAAFEKQAGIKIVVLSDSIYDFTSAGVSGMYPLDQALQELLNGTSVVFRFVAPKEVHLDVVSATEEIDVTGNMVNISSPKYTAPLRDIPQTLTVIPGAVLQEQSATTLRDALRNVPGLTIAAGEGGTPAGDNLTLRGFSARNDVFVDGARELSPQARDLFNIEQVEVVKGPGSVYSGRGSTGGSINLVSKSPLHDRIYDIDVNAGSDAAKRITADLNQPLDDMGIENGALRFNLMGQDSEFPGRNVVENKRWGFAPSLALGLGTPSRFTFGYYHLNQDNVSDYGIPWVPATNNALFDYRDRPAPVPRDTFYGFLSRDHEELTSDLGTVRYEHDYDAMTLRSQLRYSNDRRDSMATPPRFFSNDSTVITREMRSWITNDEAWDSQTDLQNRFSAFGLDHIVVSGMSLTHEHNTRKVRTALNSYTTLLNPNPNDVYTGEITPGPYTGDVTGKSAALYAFDTIRLTDHWELNGGLRWDYFGVDGVDLNGLAVGRVDRMLSWRAGALFKPARTGSIYAVVGTSFNPSLEGLSYSTANSRIGPEKSNTYEVGTKWDVLSQRLSLTAAAFRIDKDNARTPGILPDDPPQVLEGEQRVDGVEMAASGNITGGWNVLAAYTYLQSEIEDSNTPAEIGKQLQNTPNHSASLWSTYEFPFELTVGGGIRYVGKRFGNNINTRVVDSYVTFDAMVAYPVTDHINLQLNLYNLSDEFYFDRLSGGHLVPGAGRSLNFSAGFRY